MDDKNSQNTSDAIYDSYPTLKKLLTDGTLTPATLDYDKISYKHMARLLKEGLVKGSDLPGCSKKGSQDNDLNVISTQNFSADNQFPSNDFSPLPRNNPAKRRTIYFDSGLEFTWFNSIGNIFDYTSRTTRLAVWTNLFYQLLSLVLIQVGAIVTDVPEAGFIGALILEALFHVANTAMAARRLNDIGASRMLCLLCLFFGALPLIVMAFIPPNVYYCRKAAPPSDFKVKLISISLGALYYLIGIPIQFLLNAVGIIFLVGLTLGFAQQFV